MGRQEKRIAWKVMRKIQSDRKANKVQEHFQLYHKKQQQLRRTKADSPEYVTRTNALARIFQRLVKLHQ